MKDNIHPLVQELCILCTFWPTALMNVQFSQHHTVHQLKLPLDAKGLRWLVDRGVLETV